MRRKKRFTERGQLLLAVCADSKLGIMMMVMLRHVNLDGSQGRNLRCLNRVSIGAKHPMHRLHTLRACFAAERRGKRPSQLGRGIKETRDVEEPKKGLGSRIRNHCTAHVRLLHLELVC